MIPAVCAAAVRDLHREIEQLACAIYRSQRRSLHEFHHDVVRPDIVELADVGMVEGRDRPGFPLKTRGEFVLGDFDGYDTIEPCVARLVYLAHTTGAGGS